MLALLKQMRARYGSARDYLRGQGVTAAELAGLEAALLSE